MHPDELSPGDVVTVQPKTRYAAGYSFNTLQERTLEWSRRLQLAHNRGELSVVEKHDLDQLGDLHLNSDRHLYLDDDSTSGVYYDSESQSVIAANGDGPSLTLPDDGVAQVSAPLSVDGIELTGDVADPVNYGAVGDGSTDDADAFQAACDAVAPDGTVIYHQDHQVNSPINSKGANVLSLGGTIYADPNATNDQYQIGYDNNDIALLYSDGYDDVTYSVRVDGRDQYVAGAALWHGSRLSLVDCHVVDCANSGIQLMGNRDVGDLPVVDSDVRNSFVEGCIWNYVVDGEARNITFADNHSRDANARHVSCDGREAAENTSQTNIVVSNTDCVGHRPTPDEWGDHPGPRGQDYAVRPMGSVELRVNNVSVSNWVGTGLGTTSGTITLLVTDYTFRHDEGSGGTALYVPGGPVTVVESMRAIGASDGVNLYVAADEGGHVSIRNCTFIDCGSPFNNAPTTIPADWVIEQNYNDSGNDASP